jgi:methionyl-tRNA formyltransferase
VRTVVCAYSEVGYACLDELLDLGAPVPLVVTHADSPGETIWFRSVAERARAAGIPVIAPDDVNSPAAVEAIAAVQPELLFSFYFRQMLKPVVLALPTRGALNLHGSLLPRYRGRAPVNWVLVNGETETGVTLHYMDEKPDHGEVVAQGRVPIERDDTALSLTRKLALAGRAVLREAYPLLVAGRAPRVPQEHRSASYFGGRKPADGRIDWRLPSERIRNLVRAVTDPWPGAFTWFRGKKLIVWAAEVGRPERAGEPGEVWLDPTGVPLVITGDCGLRLLDVTVEGEGRASGARFAASAQLRPGERFADSEAERQGAMN